MTVRELNKVLHAVLKNPQTPDIYHAGILAHLDYMDFDLDAEVDIADVISVLLADIREAELSEE